MVVSKYSQPSIRWRFEIDFICIAIDPFITQDHFAMVKNPKPPIIPR